MTNIIVFVIIAQSIILSFMTSYVAGQKGRSKFDWFFIGLLFGFLGFLMVGFVPDKSLPDKIKVSVYQAMHEVVNTDESEYEDFIKTTRQQPADWFGKSKIK